MIGKIWKKTKKFQHPIWILAFNVRHIFRIINKSWSPMSGSFHLSFFVILGDEVTKISCHFQAKTVQLIFLFLVILTKIRKNEKCNDTSLIFFKKKKIQEDSTDFWHWKMTLKIRNLQSSSPKFKRGVDLPKTFYSKKVLFTIQLS